MQCCVVQCTLVWCWVPGYAVQHPAHFPASCPATWARLSSPAVSPHCTREIRCCRDTLLLSRFTRAALSAARSPSEPSSFPLAWHGGPIVTGQFRYLRCQTGLHWLAWMAVVSPADCWCACQFAGCVDRCIIATGPMLCESLVHNSLASLVTLKISSTEPQTWKKYNNLSA